MRRMDVGYRITKYKGKAVAVALGALFGMGLAGGAMATNVYSDRIIAAHDDGLHFTANVKATVNPGINITGPVTTANNNQGTLAFQGSTTTGGAIGTTTHKLYAATLTVAP